MERIGIRQEIEPLINAPLSILISGCLTLVGYVVAESFYHPEETSAPGGAWDITPSPWRSLCS